MAPAQHTLRLELESREDPIQGNVSDQHGTRIPFTGWLELMAAVQRLTRGSQPRPHRAPIGESDDRGP